MGYFDDDPHDPAPPPLPPAAAPEPVALWSGRLARLAGMFLLLVGLFAGIAAITEAWVLYRDPSRVMALAERLGSLAVTAGGAGAGQDLLDARLAYLVAWILKVLLLLLIGRLALGAVQVGGALAFGRIDPRA